MTRNEIYTPQSGDTFGQLCDKAYECGLSLNPDSHLGRWIDTWKGEVGQRETLVDQFHVGQSEQYENEDW